MKASNTMTDEENLKAAAHKAYDAGFDAADAAALEATA
jgi:hypothetical protein